MRVGEAPIAYETLAIGIPIGSMPSGAQAAIGNWWLYAAAGPGTFEGANPAPIAAPTSVMTRGNSSHPSGVSYYLNNFRGFSFGTTYAPTTQGAERAVDLDNVNAGFRDVVSLISNYQGNFSGVRLGISAGGNLATAENTTDGAIRHDIREWRLGSQIGYGPFTLGGFYQNSGRSGFRELNIATNATDPYQLWGAGGYYTTGPWQLAVNYAQGRVDPYGVSATNSLSGFPGIGTRNFAETWAVGSGVSYSLAPGMTPYASVTYFRQNSIITSDPSINGVSDPSNRGTVGIVGVNFTF
jgi:predicted porin